MHKQSAWHLQFILVTEYLIDDKFRNWQIFNTGLNNLSLLILIFFFFSLFPLSCLVPVLHQLLGGGKKSPPYLFLMDFH